MKRLYYVLLLTVICFSANAQTFLVDNFVGTGTLEAHTPNTGGTWNKVGTSVMTISGGDVYNTTSGVVYNYYNNVTPTSADYTVQANLIPKTIIANQGAYLVGRSNAAMTSCYYAGYIQDFNYFTIVKVVNGTQTRLVSSATYPLTSGSTYSVQFSMVGTSLKLYVNSVLVASATDAALTSAGFVGLTGQQFPAAASSTTGLHMNTLTAYNGDVQASAYSVSGVNRMINNTPSPTYTVSTNGTLATATTVTPSDNGGGGTFNPTSVTFPANSGGGNFNFTYTPSGPGTKTISYTNNGTLNNPPNTTLTVLQDVAITNSAVFYSPFNWYSNGTGAMQANNIKAASTYVQALHPGCYAEIDFTGTSLTALIDMTFNSVFAAPVKVIIDDKTAVDFSFAISQQSLVTLATGLAAGNHTCRMYLSNIGALTNRFDGTQAFKILAIGLDPGSSILTYVPKALNVAIFGDSLGEYAPDDAGVTDAGFTYAKYVGEALGEYGIVSFSGQGYLNSYNSGTGTPILPNTYSFYYSGMARDISKADVVIVNEGTNDIPSADITTTVTSTLRGMRTLAPKALFFVAVPFNQARASQVAAGYAAFNDFNSTLVNLGSEGARGTSTSTGAKNYYTYDLVHLSRINQGRISTMFLNDLRVRQLLKNIRGSQSLAY